MTCEEFTERWHDKGRFALGRLPLLLHLLSCRECRENLSFMKGLSLALKEGEIDEEAFFLAMEERLLEEAKQVVPSLSLSSPSPRLRLSLGWGACLGGVLLAFGFLLFFFGHSGVKKGITSWDILPPGGEADTLSQLGREDMVELNEAMVLSIPHVETFSTVTPWADALESAGTLSPAELEALVRGIDVRGQRTINQTGGVA
jgi:hypothetical protein